MKTNADETREWTIVNGEYAPVIRTRPKRTGVGLWLLALVLLAFLFFAAARAHGSPARGGVSYGGVVAAAHSQPGYQGPHYGFGWLLYLLGYYR